MPIGPKGEKRPTNPVESGIMVMRIATGDIEEEYADRPAVEQPTPTPNRANGGKKGGKARADTLFKTFKDLPVGAVPDVHPDPLPARAFPKYLTAIRFRLS